MSDTFDNTLRIIGGLVLSGSSLTVAIRSIQDIIRRVYLKSDPLSQKYDSNAVVFVAFMLLLSFSAAVFTYFYLSTSETQNMLY